MLLGLVAAPLVGDIDDPGQVLMHIAQTQLGTLLYIVFIGTLVSAILSTVDSALLCAGLAVYVGGAHLFETEYPCLLSLAASLIAYLLCAPLSRAGSECPSAEPRGPEAGAA